MPTQPIEFHRLPIPLDRDRFVRDLLRDVAHSLVKTLGEEKAAEFVSAIGGRVGEQINLYYTAALRKVHLTRAEVAQVMVDLKRRIEGDFFIIEENDEKIVLGNRACPFGAKVKDRPTLCMMTSNVFGGIASRNVGYAKVELQQTIANSAKECRVVVYLRPTAEAEKAPGREYTRSIADPVRQRS